MKTCPSSSISIFTPVSSIILLITFPPVPITSFIFSGFIFVVIIFGAYSDISALGSPKTGNIMSFKMYIRALCVLSNASFIMS